MTRPGVSDNEQGLPVQVQQEASSRRVGGIAWPDVQPRQRSKAALAGGEAAETADA